MKRKRVETGNVRFDSDWPGLFVRGDTALSYALALRGVLANKASLTNRWMMEGLLEKLEDTRVAPQQQQPQVVLTAELEREAIVTWLRSLARRCPEMGLNERRYWYEGVADDIEQGNGTLELIRKKILEEEK